jgi:hypothetical protein
LPLQIETEESYNNTKLNAEEDEAFKTDEKEFED